MHCNFLSGLHNSFALLIRFGFSYSPIQLALIKILEACQELDPVAQKGILIG